MSAALGAENDLLRLGLDPSEARQMEAAGSAVQLRRRATRPERPPQPLEHRHHAQSIIGQQQLDELETEVLETGLYENVDYSRGSRYSVLAAEVVFSKLRASRPRINRSMYGFSTGSSPPQATCCGV